MPASLNELAEKRRKLIRAVRRVELGFLWFALGSPVLFVYGVIDNSKLLELYAGALVVVLACDWWIVRYGYADTRKGDPHER